MLLIVWILAMVALALWSLGAWAVHALLAAAPGWVGDPAAAIAGMPVAVWLEQWVPGWQEMLRLSFELMQSALSWTHSAAPWIVWLLWGMGAAGIAITAGLLSMLIVWWRRKHHPVPVRADGQRLR